MVEGLDTVCSLHLADFGVARTAALINPTASTIAGTMEFMAPEVFGDTYDPFFADGDSIMTLIDYLVFSLGVAMYEMATGDRPVRSMKQAVNGEPLKWPKDTSKQFKSLVSIAGDSHFLLLLIS